MGAGSKCSAGIDLDDCRGLGICPREARGRLLPHGHRPVAVQPANAMRLVGRRQDGRMTVAAQMRHRIAGGHIVGHPDPTHPAPPSQAFLGHRECDRRQPFRQRRAVRVAAWLRAAIGCAQWDIVGDDDARTAEPLITPWVRPRALLAHSGILAVEVRCSAPRPSTRLGSQCHQCDAEMRYR